MAAGPANPIARWLWQKIRPDTSRAALIRYADDLADAIDRRETATTRSTARGTNTIVELEFRAGPRSIGCGDAIGVLEHRPLFPAAADAAVGRWRGGRREDGPVFISPRPTEIPAARPTRASDNRCRSASMRPAGTAAAISPRGWPATNSITG